MIHQDNKVGNTKIAPAPVGKHLWGTVTIGGKGQIVIPKVARDTFGLNEGDRLVVLGDDTQGIALVKADIFEQRMQEALDLSRRSPLFSRRSPFSKKVKSYINTIIF